MVKLHWKYFSSFSESSIVLHPSPLILHIVDIYFIYSLGIYIYFVLVSKTTLPFVSIVLFHDNSPILDPITI